MRVTLYQGRPCGRIPEGDLERIRASRPDVLCLPEYFWIPDGATSHADAAANEEKARAALVELSLAVAPLVVGGTLVARRGDALHNVCPVYERGRLAGEQAKVHPMPREREAGIVPGTAHEVIPTSRGPFGVLVCADVLEKPSFETMASKGARAIFVPTLSPHRADDTAEAKDERDRAIFAAGARTAGASVVKTCGVGRIFRSRLQGRSLVVDASGRFLARVPHEDEDRVLVLSVVLP